MRIPLPLLWGIGALLLILIALAGALPLERSGIAPGLLDMYYVVAFAHFVLPWCAAFVGFALFYLLAPKVSGGGYNAAIGAAHFWLTFLGAGLLLLRTLGLVLFGPPDVYPDDQAIAALWNAMLLIGYGLFAVGSLAFMAVLFDLVFRRRPQGSQV